MAKHVILESYTFNPITRTVEVFGKCIRREELILITNVTTNTVIYNFADSALGATNFVATNNENVEQTTIVLNYNTTGMSSNDKLSIVVDEVNETFYPAETLLDPNSKLRVSQPQSLIDTDFEYGTQATKWETLSLLNNRPSAFYDDSSPIIITAVNAVNGSRIITVNFSGSPVIPPTTATPIYIQDTVFPEANGWFVPATTGAGTFTFIARSPWTGTTGSIWDSTKTFIYVGGFYTGAGITVTTGAGAAFTFVGNLITCTTTNHHGLSVGDAIFVVGTTATTNPPNGTWVIRTTPTSNTFTFEALNVPTGTINASAGATATLFARTWGTSIHRPFDGGVEFTAGVPYHGNQLIRQTRRYFRYQSGKGIMFSTGSNFTAPFKTDNMTASGTTVTVTTKFPHNLWLGCEVKVEDAVESAYNGVWPISSVPSANTFTFTVNSAPSATPATGNWTVQPFRWYGSQVRVGMYDQQNGFFFEYDGQELFACRRSSTFQLAGYVSALTQGGQIVTGINTQWSRQLNPGDFIVVRGMSYTVASIQSDTAMTIYPEYRGTSIIAPQQLIISRTDTIKVPQSEWNIDRLDGTGNSNYNIDISKMQMWMIDYSWYGAGAIRFGFKNARGEFIYCHRMAHANLMTEAYMRSGNLPARYEVSTIAPYTKLTSTLSNAETNSINVVSTEGFPPSGVAVVTASGNTGAAIEYITYTGRTATSLTGLTRAVTNLTGPAGLVGGGGAASATTFTFSETAPIQVSFFAPQCSNTISHWGSSVMMDGRYDDDKNFLFNFGQNATQVFPVAGTRYAVFSIRGAPSVDNGQTGILGARELINRMQITLASMGVFSTTAAAVRVELILNGRITGTPGTWTSVGGASLTQFVTHGVNSAVIGGTSVFTFFAPAGGVTSQDLSRLRDLGNSILGGGNTLAGPSTSQNTYPDGPDVITLTITPLAANAAVAARMAWTEAQA
jgi:hypothetical protein